MDGENSRQRGFIDKGLDIGSGIYGKIKLARAAASAASALPWLGTTILVVFIVVVALTVFVGFGGAPLPGGTGPGGTQPPPSTLPPGNTPDEIRQNIINLLNQNTGNIDIYKQASATTGISWPVLAGIHYIEGGMGPNQSLVSGRAIGANEPDIPSCSSEYSGPGIPIALPSGGCGFSTLLDSAIYAGRHLAGKIGKAPQIFEDLVTALSRYNGGGNRNCDNSPPFQRRSPYLGCPRLFEGEDDPYALAFFDNRHSVMYLIFCADLTPCSSPVPFSRPGVMTVIRTVSDNLD